MKKMKIIIPKDVHTVEIAGVLYASTMFEQFGGLLPVGSLFRLVDRENGSITVEQISEGQTIGDGTPAHEGEDLPPYILGKLWIDELAPSLNGSHGLMRMHWTSYRKIMKRWQWKIREEWGPEKPELHGVRVHIVRYSLGRGLDLDNRWAACKVPLDALRKTGILAEDDPDAVHTLNTSEIHVDRKVDVGTEIIIAR